MARKFIKRDFLGDTMFPMGQSNRGRLWLTSAVCLAVIAWAGCSAEPTVEAPPPPRPNIVWIVLDACRAQNLSAYGYDRETSPAIDAIAERGVLFERAYSQAFGTISSVPSYMTGRYFPTYSLQTDNWRETLRIRPEEERLIPEILKANGYTTHMVSAHPFISPVTTLWKAFDDPEYIAPSKDGEFYASIDDLLPAAIGEIESNHDAPFFLYIHTLDTHFPHRPQPPFDRWVDPDFTSDAIVNGNYKQPRGNDFSDEEIAHLSNIYDGSIAYVDDRVGKIIAAIDSAGLSDNTIVIISSDHGEVLGEDRKTAGHGIPTEEVMHVPLIMAGPGIPTGVRSAGLAENADIVPTLVDVLRLATEATFHGKSLKPLWADPENGSIRSHIFSKEPVDLDDVPIMVLRSESHEYMYNPHTGTEELWAAPKTLTRRVDRSAVDHDLLAGFRDAVENDLMPLWEEYESLARRAPDQPFIETLTWDRIQNPETTLRAEGNEMPEEAHRDGRWILITDRIMCTGWNENPPPLRLSYEVPNGEYRVAVEIYSKADHHQHPASAFMLLAEGNPEVIDIKHDTGNGYTFSDIGTHEVTDESFDLTITESTDAHWIILRRIRFTPTHLTEEQQQSLEEREEQLRGLGYL